MGDEIRNSGIDVIGSVPWGTHFCQFYQTKQDLIDILVPYFKAGLENNEFCMWVTSEPLTVAEAQEAMRGAVEDFDKYLRRRQIEIIPYSEWYLLGGTFDDDRVLKGWVSKLEQALAKGYAGLRLTGNTFWLERNHWQAFTEYEAKVNNVIGRYRMIAVCTYNLDKCDGTAVIDVVKNHQFALVKQEGKWDIIESAIYKQAKEALLESEQDLNRAQAVAHTGSWRLDVWRNQLLWSDETHRIFGIPKGTPMTYETFLSSVHPEDREYVDQKWTAALRGEPYDIEHRIMVGNEVRWVREKAELEFDSQGSLKGGFGTVQDITDKVRAEEIIKQAAKRWQETFDAIPDLVSIHDREYHIVRVNKAFARAFGMTPEQLVGKTCYQVFHKTDMPVANCPHEQALKTKQPAAAEVFEPSQEAHFDVSAAPILDASGVFTGSVHIARDITERKRIENELRVKDLAVTSAISGITIADLDGNVTYANLACLSMWDYEEEEVIGKQASTFFADRSEATAVLKAVLDEGAWQGEMKARRRDGSAFDVQVSANLVTDADGEPFCMMISFVDITERKKLEQLKDDFIGLVSHELRTPLTVINGCVSTVLTEWDRLPSGEAQQLLRDAALESESLSHLVENLLELARFQAQQLALYAEPTDVKNLVRDTLNKVKRQAPSHQFVTSIPDELMLMQADPLRIERILYNLLENAAKYSPPGSQIKVSATLEPERLVIGVSDHGKGLGPSEQAKLFAPFWRLEEARPDRARGAGLGLVVCRILVEAHGGEIWVESKAGKGSTFFFTLPYRKDTDAGKISPETTK
jgi:PAS domain S-box-containing protein